MGGTTSHQLVSLELVLLQFYVLFRNSLGATRHIETVNIEKQDRQLNVLVPVAMWFNLGGLTVSGWLLPRGVRCDGLTNVNKRVFKNTVMWCAGAHPT